MSDKLEDAICRRIADDNGVSPADVRKAVYSFFDNIALEAAKLPFDNPRKIFSGKVFKQYERVYCIPYIGRLGTSYSRYLRWRANESKNENMVAKSSLKKGLSPEDIDRIARQALAGKRVVIEEEKTPHKRVWIVGEDGKKQARQVIIKDKDDV